MTKNIRKYVVAIMLLLPLCAAAGDDYRQLYQKGVEHNKRGEFAAAIDYYTKAIALNGKSADLYFVRGRAYRQNQQLDKSIDDFTKALSLKANYAEVYNQRGVTYIGKGDMKLAEADFKKACSLGHQDACKNLKQLQGPKK